MVHKMQFSEDNPLEEIRRNTLSIHRNTSAKTPPAKTPPLSGGQVSTPQNRTIGVNLAIFDSILSTVDINMLKKHPIKTPYGETWVLV